MQSLHRRSSTIQTLRGLAIFLVVLGHSMFLHRVFSVEYGIAPFTVETWLDRFFELGKDVRMPLFTVLSGFVYAFRPVMGWDLRQFFKGKVRRILVPLLVVTVLEFHYVGFRFSRAHESHEAVRGHFWDFLAIPSSHLWFLYALLWLFFIVAILDASKILSRRPVWLLLFGLACAGNLLNIPRWGDAEIFGQQVPNYAGYAGALYLAPFFILGVGLCRFEDWLFNPRVAIGVLVVLMLRVGLSLGAFQLNLGGLERLVTGICCCFLLVYAVGSWKPLAQLGGYSYAIYLYHGFGIFIAYEVLLHLNGHPSFWMFLFFGAAAGIGLPILLERTVGKLAWARTAFLGLRPIVPKGGAREG